MEARVNYGNRRTLLEAIVGALIEAQVLADGMPISRSIGDALADARLYVKAVDEAEARRIEARPSVDLLDLPTTLRHLNTAKG